MVSSRNLNLFDSISLLVLVDADVSNSLIFDIFEEHLLELHALDLVQLEVDFINHSIADLRGDHSRSALLQVLSEIYVAP